MATRLFLTIFFILCTTCCFGKNLSIFKRLPEVLSYLCPRVDVCGQTYDSYVPTVSGDEEFCCTACSCESNCETNGNCCYPSKNQYSVNDIQVNRSSMYLRECLYPTTLERDYIVTINYKSYFVITSVPNDKSCGDVKVADWGSFFPVYSASRDKIYKNIVCATSDGVSDGLHWEMIFECSFETSTQSVGNFSVKELSYFTPEDVFFNTDLSRPFDFKYCNVNFMFRDINIEHLKCYTDLIDTCSNPEFTQVPHGVNISKEDIVHACSSGLVSPYRLSEMYANVFCYICNVENYSQNNTCFKQYPTSPRGGIGETNFFGVVDPEVFAIKGIREESSMKTLHLIACDKQDRMDCRRIHCPSGQLPDRHGNCKHFITKWYNKWFSVIINVTSDVYFNVAGLIERKSYKVLTSPWRQGWFVESILQIETQFNMSYTHLRIDMRRYFHDISTVQVMKMVQKYAKQEWIMKYGTVSYIFKSDLPTWDFNFEPDNAIHLVDTIKLGNNTVLLTLPEFSIAFFTVLANSGGMASQKIISRMHYCKQIKLATPEFVLSKNKTVLFNVRTQRLMFRFHEFSIQGNHNNISNLHVMTCIEDSSFLMKSHATILCRKKIFFFMFAISCINKSFFSNCFNTN